MASGGAKGVIMDAKAKQNLLSAGRKKIGANYLQELKEEIKKISWTTKEELKTCTKITVGAIFVFGIGIYLVDLVIKGFMTTLGSFFRLIFG